MDQILAKITNLSYEIFGVFLPGFIAGLLLLLVWWTLGDLPPLLTFGAVSALTLEMADGFIKRLDTALGIGIAVPCLIATYFLGNALIWVSRSGKADPNDKPMHLLLSSLSMRIPKPEHSFAPSLRDLFDKVNKKFADGGELLDWRKFYPVGKSYLACNLGHSLVATYQNKYTFHRSIVLSAAITFWLCVLGLVVGTATSICQHVGPKWLPLSALAITSVFMVKGFTASYRLHWEMFGNTIITELYSLLFGPEPKSNDSK